MEKYEELEMEVIEFDKDDVIATSETVIEGNGNAVIGDNDPCGGDLQM